MDGRTARGIPLGVSQKASLLDHKSEVDSSSVRVSS
jgi:hypothetical protein